MPKSVTVDSLNDLVAAVRELQAQGKSYVTGDDDLRSRGKWAGGLKSMDALYTMARDGWQSEEVDTMRVATDTIAQIEKDYETEVFNTFHDVAGSYVDMDAFMMGDPDHMVEFVPATEASAKPVVTIVSSVITSAAVSPESIKRRGKSVAALVFALDRLGFNTEVWTDYTGEHGSGTKQLRCRIKSANDMLDAPRILFALAHPASTRALHMSAKGLHGKRYSGSMPTNPIEDMEPGTIYLPCILSNRDVPEAYKFVESHLRKLGIIDDDK